MTDNWYQGGEKNINLLAHLWYNLKLNQTLHPRLLFDLTTQYKLGVNSAPADELRGYNINEDLFQLNMQFGIKATKRFYYSMNMQFKTQMLQNFQTNTWKMKASLLTPGELNAGVGMAYSTKNKHGNVTFDASLSPLSYNMKMWRANYKLLDDNGEMLHPDKLEHQVGSSGEVKFGWAMTRNISLSSRIFAFSDYSYLQGDWETTLSFSINKFLSTQIYARVPSTTHEDYRQQQFSLAILRKCSVSAFNIEIPINAPRYLYCILAAFIACFQSAAAIEIPDTATVLRAASLASTPHLPESSRPEQ